VADIRLQWSGLDGAVRALTAAPSQIDAEMARAVRDSGNIARRTISASAPATGKVRTAIRGAIRVRLEGRGVDTVARVKGAEIGSHAKSIRGLLASMYERGVPPWLHNSRGIPAADFMGSGTGKAKPLIDSRLAKAGSAIVTKIEHEIRP